MTIALLCPTRGRPEQFKRMQDSARATAHNVDNIHIYAGMSPDDWKVYQPFAIDHVNTAYQFPDNAPTAYKWNKLVDYRWELGDRLFMLCADDIIFGTPCWDKALLDHYNALENKIHAYHLLDSRNPDGTPHPIVTREWIEAMGYFLPPLFLHWFVDTWTIDIAKSAYCFTHMKDYMLVHDKPSDRGQADETHNRIRNMGWHDRDKWTHEHCQHFLEFEKRRLQATILGQMSMVERAKSPLKSYGVME